MYQTDYMITLHHTTSSVLIQGNQRTVWVKKEFPLLKAILNTIKFLRSQKNINQNNNQQENIKLLWKALISQ